MADSFRNEAPEVRVNILTGVSGTGKRKNTKRFLKFPVTGDFSSGNLFPLLPGRTLADIGPNYTKQHSGYGDGQVNRAISKSPGVVGENVSWWCDCHLNSPENVSFRHREPIILKYPALPGNLSWMNVLAAQLYL
ncbi:hypothetical protein [Entomohabitans teleogrylli]|uniref:hypothetical protein n=1 Tax=Entomohabitans teleogrylli TaxID=1384589 RepID=UPI00073D7282|nr:hypothetical protein [Entomohabitans teleogrylli]